MLIIKKQIIHIHIDKMKILFFAQLILLSSCFEFDTMVSKSKEFYTNFLQKEFNITNSVILYISIALLFIIAVVFFKFLLRKKITYEDDNEDEESAPLKVKKIKKRNLKLPRQIDYNYIGIGIDS